MRIFLICPVRSATEEQKKEIQKYVQDMEYRGNKVYYPARDTNQNDKIGLMICESNKKAIKSSDEVHVYYDPNSSGTLFDLGMAFAMNKKIVLVNKVEPTDGKKSFNNFILAVNQKSVT